MPTEYHGLGPASESLVHHLTGSLTVWRIRINAIRANLNAEQVLSFRVATKTQDEAHRVANQYLTEWLHQHPGECATWVVSTCNNEELGIKT